MEEGITKFAIFANFPELICGISSRSFGDMKFGVVSDEQVVKNREHFFSKIGIDIKSVVVPHQIHSSNILSVGRANRGKGSVNSNLRISKTDGLITADKGVFLLVTTADCFSILIYDPMLKINGAFHAGWRGIINQMAPKAIDAFKKLGSDPEDLIIGLGPGICQKHFVVKNDVLSQFQALYPSSVLSRNKDGYVDLKKAILTDFKIAGVLRENIEIANFCPLCDNGLFGSFRKEKDAVPASAAVIGMRE